MLPYAVSQCLYSGISKDIAFLRSMIKSKDEKFFMDKYNQVEEALEWYKYNCMVSYNYLKEEFNELTESMKL